MQKQNVSKAAHRRVDNDHVFEAQLTLKFLDLKKAGMGGERCLNIITTDDIV